MDRFDPHDVVAAVCLFAALMLVAIGVFMTGVTK